MLETIEIQRLLDIACLGFQRGKGKLARDIVAGLDTILTDDLSLEICRAMGFYTVDRFEEAREVLDNAMETFPDNSMVWVHLALVDILETKNEDAKVKIDRVMEKGDDEAAVALAKTFRVELV